MAKKQVYGDEALKLKMSQRKMAKVIISQKRENGSIGYKETTLDVEEAKEFIAAHK